MGIDFYCVIDDDTNTYEIRHFGTYIRKANYEEITNVFCAVSRVYAEAKGGDFWTFTDRRNVREDEHYHNAKKGYEYYVLRHEVYLQRGARNTG